MIKCNRKVGFIMRWIPLQKTDSRKWILCVLYNDCMTYEVTKLESEHVETILSYAAYMNDGIDDGIETEVLEKLDKQKKQYKLS